MLLLAGLLLLNFGISWFNAYSVGRSWSDSKAIGGFPRFITWCGAIMSASGFTWVYVTVLAIAAGAFHWLPPKYVTATMELGYVVIILPILGSGLAITIDSWTTAYRERTIASGGVAAWNTFAQVYNTYEAVSALPGILDDLKNTFSSADDDDDSSGSAVFLVILLVIMALVGGILTTTMIIRSTAAKYTLRQPRPVR